MGLIVRKWTCLPGIALLLLLAGPSVADDSFSTNKDKGKGVFFPDKKPSKKADPSDEPAKAPAPGIFWGGVAPPPGSAKSEPAARPSEPVKPVTTKEAILAPSEPGLASDDSDDSEVEVGTFTPGQLDDQPEEPKEEEKKEDDDFLLFSDRPNVANAPIINGEGVLTLELGLVWTGNRAGRDDSLAIQPKLRYAFCDFFEIQFGLDLYSWSDSPDSDAHSGVGDGFINLRAIVYDFGEWYLPILGAEFLFTIPFAQQRPDIGSGEVSYTWCILLEWNLTDWMWIDTHTGLVLEAQRKDVSAEFAGFVNDQPTFNVDEGSDYEFQQFFAVALGLPFVRDFIPYVELAWFSTNGDGDGDQLVFNTGFQWRIIDTLIVDSGIFFGLTEETPDIAVSFGLATYLGRLGIRDIF